MRITLNRTFYQGVQHAKIEKKRQYEIQIERKLPASPFFLTKPPSTLSGFRRAHFFTMKLTY